MELNERIAAVRKAAGLTQEQLGELVGVTRQAVSKWESGQTVPDAVTVGRLCLALHVSADYVLQRARGDRRRTARTGAAGALPLLRPKHRRSRLSPLRLSPARYTAVPSALCGDGVGPVLCQSLRRGASDAFFAALAGKKHGGYCKTPMTGKRCCGAD